MGTTTNILDMNNRISALEKDVTSVEEAVDGLTERFDGLKLYKKEISVTFNNKIYAGSFNISTETGGIVTSSNIKGMAVTGIGVAMYPVLSSNKSQFYIYSNEVQNVTTPAECIFFYT
jgi:hypothetical protein